MFLGETGDGKTSFLNLLYNTGLLRLGRDDWGAFNDVTVENALDNPSASKTSASTTYTVDLGLQQHLRVIDTPGYGDTRGMGYDKKHTASIVQALKEAGEVNSIVLVINGRKQKIGPTLRYVLSQICAVMPKSILDNIIVLFTNCRDVFELNFDVKSLSEFVGREISDDHVFYIENPFCKLAKAKARPGLTAAHVAGALHRDFSEARVVVEAFWSAVARLVPVASNVFQELYVAKEGIEKRLLEALAALDNERQFEKQLTTKSQELDSVASGKRAFADYVTVTDRTDWIPIDTPEHNTLCAASNCHSVCHAGCYLPRALDPEPLRYCGGVMGEKCQTCGHSYKDHYHGTKIWEKRVTKERTTQHEKKAKYEGYISKEQRVEAERQDIQRRMQQCQVKQEAQAKLLQQALAEYERLALIRSYRAVLSAQIELLQQRVEEGGPGIQAIRDMKGSLEQQLSLLKP